MDRKEVRRIALHTFAGQRTDQHSWHRSAVSFRDVAMLIKQHENSISGSLRVCLLNAALSIELLLKSIIVAKGEIAPKHHNLVDLARDGDVRYSTDQRATLELLAEILKWSGRYPVPIKEETWDHYYDHVFEKHITRQRDESVVRIWANPDTFPSLEKYQELWDLANRKWDEIQFGTG